MASERPLGAVHAAALIVASMVGTGSQAASAEVTIDADYNLDYENVIKCITHVSGEKDAAGHITKMVEKIKFAPPRPPGG